MEDENLYITRRHLPHWTMSGATYFVTYRTKRGSLTLEEQRLTLGHIRAGDGKYYTLIAAIVMPDHVHLLLTPNNQYSLSRIMKAIKGVSARKINILRDSSKHVWQDESYDRLIRNQAELLQKLDYMLNNPLKANLTDDPWQYHGWYCNLENVPL